MKKENDKKNNHQDKNCPCPTCKEANQLSIKELEKGKQCDHCRLALEVGYGW